MVKKVLIISYYFMQREEVATVRLQGLAKYLPYYGWEPVVLTVLSNQRQASECEVYATQYSDLTKKIKELLGLSVDSTLKEQLNLPTYKNKNTLIDLLLKIYEEIYAYPDTMKGWYKFAVDKGEEILSRRKFDAVISSSGPATAHLIAGKLIEKRNMAWIAEFRDLWTQNHYVKYGPVRKHFEKKLEYRTLLPASALVTVSEPLAFKLKTLHQGKSVYAVPNGFDPKIINTGNPLSEDFKIVYTGRLYKGKQDTVPLLKVLSELSLNSDINLKDVKVDFYGHDEGWLNRDVDKYGFNNVVSMKGMIPREEAIQKQRESQILLLLGWNDPREKGVYTGKLFEYLAAKRPIISIGPPGCVIEELLNKTKAGIHVTNSDQLKTIIKKSYREFKSAGEVSYHGIQDEIDKYSHLEMAKKYADVLNRFAR